MTARAPINLWIKFPIPSKSYPQPLSALYHRVSENKDNGGVRYVHHLKLEKLEYENLQLKAKIARLTKSDPDYWG